MSKRFLEGPQAAAMLRRLKELELPLRRWALPDRFHRVEVETDSRCNRACGYCPVAVAPREAHRMPEDLFFRIVDQLVDLRFLGRFSPHFFGEPLADPRLPTLLAGVRARLPRARLVVYTNGDLLNPDRARALLDAGVSLFIVTYEHAPPAAWRRTEAGLRPAERRRFLVRAFDDAVPAPYNRGGTVGFAGTKERHGACIVPASTVVVDAWGKVRLCSNDYRGEVEWGDLATEHLAEVWQKPGYRALRRSLLDGSFTLPTCRRCVGIDPGAPLG
ncbi:radical SAM protein [Myxococcota bacterium]|nr:radical SAM protein [Myxococcota bacterium]